jgi:hypothetical protein
MKIVTGFLLASAFALVPQTLASGVPVGSLKTNFRAAAAGWTKRVGSAVKASLASDTTPVLDLDEEAKNRFLRAGPPNRTLTIPRHYCEAGKKHDVLVHFHGVPQSVEPSFERSGLDAVMVIVNWGIGSGAYEDYFTPRGALDGFLEGIEKSIDKACGTTTGGLGRLALSSWSAGYGAIYRILLHPEEEGRIDALLMSDGMHVGYVRPGQVNPESMQVFADFAHLAATGKKLFAITHSNITPPGYASTRDTADYLVAHEKLTLALVDEQGPRPQMRLTSRADEGNFHVRGFAGMVAKDHCQHLHAMGETLFPLLRDHWSR